MNNEWYYGQHDQQLGPVSIDELKALAAAGQLARTDIVWTEGFDDWIPAAEVEGLFPLPASPPQQATTPKPTPPPIHEPQGSQSPDAPTESKFKASLSALKANMKSAGQLVANQAKRTKIAQVTLPSAYRELGRRVYESGPYRDEFPEQYGLLDDFEAKLEPTEEGKGLAASAKSAVNMKVLKSKQSRALATLGRIAYEKHGQAAGPEDLIQTISKCCSALETLDAEIVELSQPGQGQVLTPKRIAIGGLVVVAVLLFFLFKLPFSGTHQSEQSASDFQRQQDVKQKLSDADKTWVTGKKADAVDVYESLLSGRDGVMVLNRYMSGELPRIFRRVIDYRIEQGGLEAARDNIKRALQWGVTLSLSSPEANEFVAKIRAEYEEEKNRYAEQRAREEERKSRSSVVSTNPSGASFPKNEMETKFKALVNQVRPGMSSANVAGILGQPTKVELIEFNGKKVEIWEWKGRDTSNSFIMLNMENGVVTKGGTLGYDIKTGFKATLPKGLSPSERKRREKAAKALGIKIE
jgi:hypothetical protein